jgi:superfamily II DNA/RNA helicase
VAALTEQGVTTPFPIQAATLPDALAGENVLGRARTGAGKTLGFGLPLLARLANLGRAEPSRPRGLVLVPTRELAGQVHDALQPLARPLGVHLTAVYGGVSIVRQTAALRRGVHLLVATPGRLVDLIERGACSLRDVEVTVLDEADFMCDLGFLPAVRGLLDGTAAGGQRLLFSATLDREVEVLVRDYLPNPVLVAVDPEMSQVTTLRRHALEASDQAAQIRLVTALAGGFGRTLVFTRTKRGADRLARQLTTAGVPAQPLHGGLPQARRTRALARFAHGTQRVLVATDVAARGIHVDDVSLVIHVGPPDEPKTYQHRGGRTARAGASGADVIVALPAERAQVRALLKAVGCLERPRPADADDPVVRTLAGPPAPRITPPAVPAADSGTPTVPAPRTPMAAARTGGPRSGRASAGGRGSVPGRDAAAPSRAGRSGHSRDYGHGHADGGRGAPATRSR